MGKKPVIGLAGLFLAGLAVCGCQDSRMLCCNGKDKSCNSIGMANNTQVPGSNGVKHAGAWSNQPGGTQYSPSPTFGAGSRPGANPATKPNDIVPAGAAGRPNGGAPVPHNGAGMSDPGAMSTPAPGGAQNMRSTGGMSPDLGKMSGMDPGARSLSPTSGKPVMPAPDTAGFRNVSPMPTISDSIPLPPPPPSGATLPAPGDAGMPSAPSGGMSNKIPSLPDLPPPPAAKFNSDQFRDQ